MLWGTALSNCSGERGTALGTALVWESGYCSCMVEWDAALRV